MTIGDFERKRLVKNAAGGLAMKPEPAVRCVIAGVPETEVRLKIAMNPLRSIGRFVIIR